MFAFLPAVVCSALSDSSQKMCKGCLTGEFAGDLGDDCEEWYVSLCGMVQI